MFCAWHLALLGYHTGTHCAVFWLEGTQRGSPLPLRSRVFRLLLLPHFPLEGTLAMWILKFHLPPAGQGWGALIEAALLEQESSSPFDPSPDPEEPFLLVLHAAPEEGHF